MPWTTGILVGIGETPHARRLSLEAIARIHSDYGHIQEVIIQPFTPHANTLMENWSAPTIAELRDSVKLAREVLPAEIVVQIPPNIAPEILEFIAAGARDLGGISPDGDRINPLERWLTPERYRLMLAPHDCSLQPRLAVHERFVSTEWLATETFNAVASARGRLPISSGLPSALNLTTQHRLYSPQRITNAAFHI
jgi:FO synthase subunit 1